MKARIKRSLALIAAVFLTIAPALPVLAGGGLSMLYENIEPGYSYDLIRLSANIPLADQGYDGIAQLSGTGVSGNAFSLEEGQGPYNFVWEQTISNSDSYIFFGCLPQLMVGHSLVGTFSDFSQQIPIDGANLFGFQNSPAEISIKMTITDAQLNGRSEDLFMYDEYYAVGPYIPLVGKLSVEITTTIDGTYSIPNYTEITDTDPSAENFGYEIQRYMESTRKQLDAGVTDGFTFFDKPKTITARIDLDGTLSGFDGIPEMDVLAIASQVSSGQHTYTVDYDGDTYVTQIQEIDNGIDTLYVDAFSINCPLYVQALSWTVSPYTRISDGSDDHFGGTYVPPADEDVGGYGDPFWQYWDVYPDYENITNRPGKVVLAALGTGAAALGVSIVASLIGDGLASATASAFSGTISGAVSGTVSVSADSTISGATSTAASSSGSGSTSGTTFEPDNSTPTDKNRDNEIADDKSKHRDTKNKNGEEHQADEQPDDGSETPDLPEEDSPNVSMSLFAPATDLLNIKGGAADITVQISGGDGYLWHYIPAVIVPGSLKAIVPSVTGHGNLATLVLGMTGAALEERHYEVHINLIAWTTTPEGKLLKTSKSMEMKLHQPGIEAKRNEKGFPSVTAYVETTMKGFAEIRKLSSDEYTYTKLEDGTLEIKAVNPKLGTTLLKP